jgi:LDH2 family malate/lactate/ureidoglycolate dehydrogenase
MPEFIDHVELRRWTAAVFRRLGATRRASREAAEALHYADVNGIDTHGVANLERIYVRKCETGEIDPTAAPALALSGGAVAVVDGRGGLGMVAAARAMRLAIRKAARYGIGAVAVRNSSHFGAAGYYSSLAMDAGMVGLAMTNLGGQAVAPPPGGLMPMLGTNPLSAAVPAGELPPFVLDMSTTAASAGKVRLAARRGEPAPPGWLADGDGRPALDPADYDRGTAFLQFTGGHKGFNLAVLVDVLCGVLSGAAVGPSRSTSGASDHNVGHFLLAINPRAFGAAGFRGRMDEMLSSLLACPTASPAVSVRYAGCEEARINRQRRESGVPLDETLVASFVCLAARLGLPAFPRSKEREVIS